MQVQNEYPALPYPVYPGHALVVALYIMKAFPNASSALAPTQWGFPGCVGSCEVPGAGDGAHAGAALIRTLRQVKLGISADTLDSCVAWSQEEWRRRVGPGSGNHEGAFEPGRKQATELEHLFRERVELWDWT